MREIGRIALEWEVRPGDMIVSQRFKTIYTILGLSPSSNLEYSYTLHCHAVNGNQIGRAHV